MKTLLVPVDFSTCSMPLVNEAAALAKDLGAQIALLHVAETPTNLPPGVLVRPDGVPVEVDALVADDSTAHLAPFARKIRDAGVTVQVLARRGPIVDTIHDVASEVNAKMIMMGTHGRSGVARMVLGSIAESVVRRATVPVVLVRRQHRAACASASCNWCSEAVRTDVEDRVRAESDG